MTLGFNESVSWKTRIGPTVLCLLTLITAFALHLPGLAITVSVGMAMLVPAMFIGWRRERASKRTETSTVAKRGLGQFTGPIPGPLPRRRRNLAAVQIGTMGVGLTVMSVVLASQTKWIAAVALACCGLLSIPFVVAIMNAKLRTRDGPTSPPA